MVMRKEGSGVGGTGTMRVDSDEYECDLTEVNSGEVDESVGEGECSGRDAYGDHGDVQTVGIVVLQSSSRPHCGQYPSHLNVSERAHCPLTTEVISRILLVLLPISLLL